jgi:hypothetical protein
MSLNILYNFELIMITFAYFEIFFQNVVLKNKKCIKSLVLDIP